jgi:hypothetical protein
MNRCRAGKRGHRLSLLLAVLVASAILGCGGGVVVDHGGRESNGNSGAGGAGTITTSTGTEANTTGSSNSAPSRYGTPDVACIGMKYGNTNLCVQVFKGGELDHVLKKQCIAEGSSLVTACPAAGVSGCCGTPEKGGAIAEECRYGVEPVNVFMKECKASHGTFSTSP